MDQVRKPRAAGEKLLLGGMEYRIEDVRGYGGSVIVYRASYRDGLNQDKRHEVLLKELFPYHKNGWIYRGEDGNICCRPQGKALMERCRQGFYKGNEANLNLLRRMPEQVSGSLNSFEAYGTFYSILPVHGGKSLQKILDEKERFVSLREAAAGIKMILEALQCFHDNGILHLDISPDNILMLPFCALLIDYNSVWPMQRAKGETYYFSEKKGYTAPEIRLKEEENVSVCADLYSVSAIFYRMLTGHILSDEIMTGKKIWKSFPKNLEIFLGEPVSAAYKAVSIIRKGLHILVRMRYQTIEEMQKDLDELICRIDGKGVSYSALFEGSLRELKKNKSTEERYLPRRILLEREGIVTEQACRDMLLDGEPVFLEGEGGMGKTRFLMRLWQTGMDRYHENGSVWFYIPLIDYLNTDQEKFFIRRYLLRHFCFLRREETGEEALKQLDLLLGEPCDCGKYMFLLDGFNEAGTGKGGLIQEIEELGGKDSVGILVSGRIDSVKKYALPHFSLAKLLPLTDREAALELEKDKIALPDGEAFLDLLTNPMMLFLYRNSCRMMGESEDGQNPDKIKNMDEMIDYYLKSLYMRECRQSLGERGKQVFYGYIIYFLLPDIAREMKRKNKGQLSLEEMYAVVRRNYRKLKGKSFAMAFPQYLGKTRLMLQGIENEREWFDYALEEELAGNLNLIVENNEKCFRLMHENFIPYLSVLAKENHKKRKRYQLRQSGLKAGIAIAVLLTGAAAGVSIWREYTPAHLSGEEEDIVYSAVQRMIINVGICNFLLRGQDEILAAASTDGVLRGNLEDMRFLQEMTEAKTEEARNRFVSYRDGKNHLRKLEDMGEAFPVDLLEGLYQRPEELLFVTEHAGQLLQERLCRTGSVYNTYDKRKPLTDAYAQYLDAYARMCAAEYSQMIYSLKEIGAQRAAEEAMDGAIEMLAVGKYVRYNDQTEITDALTEAKRRLYSAVREMKRQGLL